MDFALITNLLLFLGAMGVTFALDGGSSGNDDEEDAASEAAMRRTGHGAGWDETASGDDSLAADRDNLAWFLNSGDLDPEPQTGQPAADAAAEAAREAEEPLADAAQTAPEEAPEAALTDAAQHAREDISPEDAPEAALTDAAQHAPDAPPFVAPTEEAQNAPEDAAMDATPTIDLAYLPALDPETGLPLAPDLGVTPTEDGLGSVIWLDGFEVARFDDLPDLTPDQIRLTPEDPDAPAEEATARETDEETGEETGEDIDTPIEIAGFTPGAERIEIAYHPALDAAGNPLVPEIRIEQETGEEPAAQVLLDGQVVARVLGSGAAQLRPADILTLPL